MQNTRNSLDTNPGRATGSPARCTSTRLRHRPPSRGPARPACIHAGRAHRVAHPPHGQTIWVTEGVGLCQREGGLIEVIRPGDRVFFEPGENHWHGAAPTRFMAHIAMQQADDDGNVVAWVGTSATTSTRRCRRSRAAIADARRCHVRAGRRPRRRARRAPDRRGDGRDRPLVSGVRLRLGSVAVPGDRGSRVARISGSRVRRDRAGGRR